MNTRLLVDACLLLVTYVSVFYDASALTLQCNEDGYTGESSYFYRQLESALLRNPNALYALHTAFFEQNRAPRETTDINLHLTINHMGPSNCTTAGPNQWSLANGTNYTAKHNDSQLYEHSWRFKWIQSAVLSQINVGELLIFNNLLTYILYSRVGRSNHRHANITLHVPSLPCKLTRDDVLWTVTTFLAWSKAYARDQGRPITWRDEDRGYVSLRYNYWVTEGISDSCKFDSIQTTRILLLVLYLSLNLLVPVLLVKFGATCYRKASQSMLASRPTFLLYWAVVIVIVFWNTSSLIASAYMYKENKGVKFYSETIYSDGKATLAARITLLPLVYTLELLIAARIPKDTGLLIPSVIQRMFFCCLCFSSSIQSKIIQTLAVWNIMIFIQSLTTNAITVGVFFLISPLWVVSVLGAIACGFLFAVVAVAYLLHHCKTNRNQKCSCKRFTINCTGIFLSFLIVITLLSVYFLMTYKISGGVTGFLVSFLPPVVLSLIGWCVKKRIISRMNFQATSNNTHAPDEVEMDPLGETEPLIDAV